MDIIEVKKEIYNLPKTSFGFSIPEIRKLAKKMANNDYEKFIEENENNDYWLRIFHAFLIGYIKADIKILLKYFEQFMPYVDDWAVNDSLCQNFKIARKYQKEVWDFLMKYKDYYEILGVDKSATEAQIKSAYRKMAKKYHPDVDKSPSAQEKFKDINEAYEVLSDKQKRSRYDSLGSNWQGGADFTPPPGFEFNFEDAFVKTDKIDYDHHEASEKCTKGAIVNFYMKG